MNTTHHPSDETLAAFTRGSLDEGRSVVVAAHIELCPSCRRLGCAIDHAAGLHLEVLEQSQLAEDALDRVMARLDEPLPVQKRLPRVATADLPAPLRALEPYELGPWRWIGPGVRWRSASVPAEHGARVFLLKAAPGTRLPHHTHTGTELTLVLKGAFAHEGGRFGVGDMEEADKGVEHRPVVEPGEECICLVAMEGRLRLLGLAGRILQPFVRL